MKLLALPPVRRCVPRVRSAADIGYAQVRDYFSQGHILLFGSGTQALTVALVLARVRWPVVEAPEAILPSYCCPDLVSACVGAGVMPVFADMATSEWRFDVRSLECRMSKQTVAIVAMDLLGIGDDSPALQELADRSGALLIRDSAQHLPCSGAPLEGGAMVLSFGRGKPLNLLGGGALLTKSEVDMSAVWCALACQERRAYLPGRLSGEMFNIATSRYLYGAISRIPGLGLGETRYREPEAVSTLDDSAWGQVGPALREFNYGESYDARPWQVALDEWKALGIVRLQGRNTNPASEELLRLPLLARDLEHRNCLVDSLGKAGIGASRMYGTTVERLPGVPHEVASQGPFPGALALADRLFTLPTHLGVTKNVVEQANSIVNSVS